MAEKFIRFWHLGTDGKPRPACGSDSAFYGDGRWSNNTLIYQAVKHAHHLNKFLGKEYIGYSINDGSKMVPLRNIP